MAHLTKDPYSLLTLIQGGEIHPLPGTKVIKKDLFSDLIRGKELIEKVLEEARVYRIEAVKEVEAEKQRAREEGFQEGFESWLQEIDRLQQEVVRLREQLEAQAVSVAIRSAKKIVSKELETHPETILDIVRNHLKAVSQSKRITITVSREDFELLDKSRNQLKERLESLEMLTIRFGDELSKGSCVIETESGIVNARIENQWERIERAFGIEDSET